MEISLIWKILLQCGTFETDAIVLKKQSFNIAEYLHSTSSYNIKIYLCREKLCFVIDWSSQETSILPFDKANVDWYCNLWKQCVIENTLDIWFRLVKNLSTDRLNEKKLLLHTKSINWNQRTNIHQYYEQVQCPLWRTGTHTIS